MATHTLRLGIIGLGLMGRELGSAIARWCHLLEELPRPTLLGICDTNQASHAWFVEHFPSIKIVTTDYRELLSSKEIDVIYCAVPHNLHERIYIDTINAGKHLMGEKPFGIDLAANRAIAQAIAVHPEVFVRCSSEFPFVPAMQRLCAMIETGAFGQVIEVESGFIHSSDLNPQKPINWKRRVETNGDYGCLGDLGMHPCHVPFRAGWYPKNVRAILSNIMRERPDGKGGMAACETWDNATLLCDAIDPLSGQPFPLTIKTQRIAPGEKNTWYLSVLGTKASARFSTKNINTIELLEYTGGEQAWQRIDMGNETTFKTITGEIFEFGFSDAVVQMWAAFFYELAHGRPKRKFAGCVTPSEAAASHRLFTAALESQRTSSVVAIHDPRV